MKNRKSKSLIPPFFKGGRRIFFLIPPFEKGGYGGFLSAVLCFIGFAKKMSLVSVARNLTTNYYHYI